MDLTPVQRRIPFAIALLIFILAYVRPEHRTVWFSIGCAFLVIGLIRSKRARE
ncbi:MAG TPA: hypothetical protein VLA89_03340 [Gemmatimonadales bacterium]|nr:hypothetical protein [Gemmatimonadales bacterium]